MITISDWLLAIATVIGPIAAVQAQKWVERGRETRKNRLQIFHSLMATRAAGIGSAEHVQALNLIELRFNRESQKDRAVRNAWESYLDHLNQVIDNYSPEQMKVHASKSVDFLVRLLASMAQSLGYEFNDVQLKRGGYYPRGYADQNNNNALIQQGLVRVLRDGVPFPMAVKEFPITAEARMAHEQVQTALFKTLSGETPLKVANISS
jgi:hypothetical protein